jgi:hypothetical protein
MNIFYMFKLILKDNVVQDNQYLLYQSVLFQLLINLNMEFRSHLNGIRLNWDFLNLI